jgi:hypothetical protein
MQTKSMSAEVAGRPMLALMRAIAGLLSSSSSVHTFELSGVHLEASMVAKLAVGLKNNTALRYLTLRKVSVGDDGMTHLAPALGKTHVKVLTMHDCGITDDSDSLLATVSTLRSRARRSESDECFAPTVDRSSRTTRCAAMNTRGSFAAPVPAFARPNVCNDQCALVSAGRLDFECRTRGHRWPRQPRRRAVPMSRRPESRTVAETRNRAAAS